MGVLVSRAENIYIVIWARLLVAIPILIILIDKLLEYATYIDNLEAEF